MTKNSEICKVNVQPESMWLKLNGSDSSNQIGGFISSHKKGTFNSSNKNKGIPFLKIKKGL